MDISLEKIFYIMVELTLILILIAVGAHYSGQNTLANITKAYIEIGATKGGFTSSDIQELINDLAKNGYEPANLEITISPAEAVNITAASYAHRGTKITLQVCYKKKGLLNIMFEKIGVSNNIYNTVRRAAMSEKP